MKSFAKNSFFLLILPFLGLHSLWGQDIWVEDGITGEPLENVVVFSEDGNHNLVTNALGKAVLNNFPRKGKIKFNVRTL